MIVYLRGEKQVQKASHSLFVCPASDLRKADCPSDWLTEEGRPMTMEVDFKYGRAEVPSNLGEYLVRQGFAFKSKLIIPDGVKVA